MNSRASTRLDIIPQSVICDWDISDKTLVRLERLENYDLSKLTTNFIDKGRRFSPEQVWPIKDHFGKADLEIATLLEKEFRRFVALTLLRSGLIYAPSGPVDMYWHFLVLHTREYEKFCRTVWGMSPPDHGALPRDQNDKRTFDSPLGQDQSKEYPYGDLRLVPRNVLKDLTFDTVHRLWLLERWDLNFFTARLVSSERQFSPEQVWPIKAHFGKADVETARLLEWEFKKFVALTLIEPGLVFAPSGPVDMYWHFMILHTKEYREFCQTIWGSFQHHPRGSLYEDERESGETILLHHEPLTHEGEPAQEAFKQVLEAYTQVYEHLDSQVWFDPNTEIV